MSLRLGLLGAANINAKLVAGARLAEGVEVVALASRDLGRAREQASELEVPRALGSYLELLADPEVDAVYVPLPNSMHVDWSVQALEAGKHVLCEKPLSRSPDEVERAFDAAEDNDRVLAEAFMWRHHPQAKRLRELAAELGEIRLVRGAFSFPLGQPGNVRWSAELDGGALMDVGCYCVSGARLLLGEPTEVSGHCTGEEVDARFVGTMRFESGALAHFDCGFDLTMRDELEVVGEGQALFLDDPWHSVEPVIEVRDGQGGIQRVEVDRANPYACELEDFARACAGEEEPEFGREDAVGQARAIAALYEAAGSGRAVSV
jgi:D-xylose 1-dehydrogenase (NADP+, D-xylono-1,5-lactone-forming)